MKKKINVAFDLDGIFVSLPPFVPIAIINLFYKKRDNGLSYRLPGKIERQIRIFSHAPIFRPPIKDNIVTLAKIFNEDKFLIYLISSRFSFLRNRTEEWNRNHKISEYFEKMYFNFDDEQPHLFKNKIIKKEKINIFIDDDLDLLLYLAAKNPNVNFYWLSGSSTRKNLPRNITHIKTLSEFLNYV